MSAWREYLATTRRVSELGEQAAALVAEREATARAARAELAAVHQRLVLQRTRLTEVAGRAGLTVPPLVDAAGPDFPGIDAARAGLTAAAADLDGAEQVVAEIESARARRGPLPYWTPAWRNLPVYGGFALLVLLAQVLLFAAPTRPVESVVGVLAGSVLPIVGYGLSWVSIGLLYGERGRSNRTPLLGAAVSLAPVVLLCVGFGLFTLLR